MPTSLDDLLARFDDTLPLERARTIPASWYLDPAVHAAERERIFGRSWQVAGRLDQLAQPGSFFTIDLGGLPILVVRGEDGEVRAFYNVCRHRAARIACEEQGCVSRLRCHYHGWTYDLAGRLRGVPEFDRVEDFRREDNGLVPLAVGTWANLVWVCPQPATSLGEWVAPLVRFDLERRMTPLRFVARREYAVACDWKVYCDNYLDGGYHVNYVHPALGSVIDYANYRNQIDGHANVQRTPLTKPQGEEKVAAVRRGEAAYAWIFPNLMINVSDGLMDTNLVLPDGPGRCRVLFDFYFADVEGEPARRFIDESMAVADQVQREDVAICEEVQRGLRSGSFDVGRFSVRREGTGYHFHQLLARWLRT